MIRNATVADVPRMVELGKQMHAASKFRAYSFDVAVLEATINGLIDKPRGIALVSEVDGVIVGGFIGYLTEHFFGFDLASYDLALFLEPEHRGGITAARLIKAYIDQAREKGAAEIVVANSTGIAKERTAQLFARAGFSHDGYVFSMKAVQ